MNKSGLVLNRQTPAESIEAIVRADKLGVETVWSITGGLSPDAMTYYAGAAVQTKQITFGTSIVPILPRHPLVLASQAMVFASIAPGRLRLGIGPSHKLTMERFGIPFNQPLEHLAEYLQILRNALWEGKVDFTGTFYSVHQMRLMPDVLPPKTPIFMSALREKAFQLAGEISDGAISWMCPISYLVKTALPALSNGAKKAKRKKPPLIAHVPVAVHTDKKAVRNASLTQLGRYGKMAYYARMFADAGEAIDSNGTLSNKLIDDLVVSGNAEQIADRLNSIKRAGIEELLILPIVIDDQNKEELALIDILTHL